MRLLVPVFAIQLSVSIAFATEEISGYLCIPEQVIGFTLEESKWTPRIFNVRENSGFVVKQLDNDYWYTAIADNDKPTPCRAKFDSRGFYECRFDGIGFYFSRESLRFQLYLRSGYVLAKDLLEHENSTITPSISIGVCSPIVGSRGEN